MSFAMTITMSCDSSFSNFSVTSPTLQRILQPFRHFTYVTAHSPTLPLLHLSRWSFSNSSFASPTPHALPLRHLASRPCAERSCGWHPSSPWCVEAGSSCWRKLLLINKIMWLFQKMFSLLLIQMLYLIIWMIQVPFRPQMNGYSKL